MTLARRARRRDGTRVRPVHARLARGLVTITLCCFASVVPWLAIARDSTALSLVAVGNSITVHGPAAGLGWTGNWGMAAQSEQADYAGRLRVLLADNSTASATRVTRIGFTAIETAPPGAPLAAEHLAAVRSSQWLVLQLGDNVPAGRGTEFGRAYALLALQARPQSGALACLSTWWARSDIDALIEAACKAAGGRFVAIGDLLTARPAAVPAWPGITDAGVLAHPRDAEMAQIAQRIFVAWRGAGR